MSSVDPAVLRSLSRVEDAALQAQESTLERLFVDKKDDNGVTIFVPNWNQRTYLPRSLRTALHALDSLQEVAFGGEVLCADDGSRDGSQRLISSIESMCADRRLSSVMLRRNMGLPRLRNLALRLARYRFVLFLDADNALEPKNLVLFVRAIRETQAAMVYGNLLDRDDYKVTGVRSNMMATMSLFDENYIDAFALCDATQLLEAGGYVTYPQLYGWEDWELVLHLANGGYGIVFVPAVMGYYAVGRRSMLSETNERAMERRHFLQRIHTPVGPPRGVRAIGRMYHPDLGYLDSAR
jgi:glycosyltransferase involved in cell wall biosynthesis